MYYQCPECGFKQKSEAVKRITCHRCNRSYQRVKAKKEEKTPDKEKGIGFFKYTDTDADVDDGEKTDTDAEDYAIDNE